MGHWKLSLKTSEEDGVECDRDRIRVKMFSL